MLEVDLVIGEKINSHVNKTDQPDVVGADSELNTPEMSRNETNSKNVVAELNMLEDPEDMLDSSSKSRKNIKSSSNGKDSVIMSLNHRLI